MFGVVTVIRRSQPAQTEDGPDQLPPKPIDKEGGTSPAYQLWSI